MFGLLNSVVIFTSKNNNNKKKKKRIKVRIHQVFLRIVLVILKNLPHLYESNTITELPNQIVKPIRSYITLIFTTVIFSLYNQKLCYFHFFKISGNETKNFLKDDWCAHLDVWKPIYKLVSERRSVPTKLCVKPRDLLLSQVTVSRVIVNLVWHGNRPTKGPQTSRELIQENKLKKDNLP